MRCARSTASVSENGDRRRGLRPLADHYQSDLAIGPDAVALRQLGGERAAMVLLEAAWAEIADEQVYRAACRPWAWHEFTRPDVP